MAAEKNYRSFTGLTEFYYKVHGEDGAVNVVKDPERIKYLQADFLHSGSIRIGFHFHFHIIVYRESKILGFTTG